MSISENTDNYVQAPHRQITDLIMYDSVRKRYQKNWCSLCA